MGEVGAVIESSCCCCHPSIYPFIHFCSPNFLLLLVGFRAAANPNNDEKLLRSRPPSLVVLILFYIFRYSMPAIQELVEEKSSCIAPDPCNIS
jgi:hypothetical protein